MTAPEEPETRDQKPETFSNKMLKAFYLPNGFFFTGGTISNQSTKKTKRTSS
jgi:hypothetical protein